MANTSRRGFLKTVSATAAALATSSQGQAWANAAAAAGPVRIWGTFRDRRHAPGDPLAWKSATEVASDAIALDPGMTRQEMLGFGASLTDASCYMLSRLRGDERAALMNELFAPGEMGMNVCRTCIGSSDYSTELFSYDDSEQDDPELRKFSINHDKTYVLPVLKQARQLNPDLFLLSSPWSPPAWMKFNRNLQGGTIKKSTLEPFSRYMLKFLEAYAAEGVPIDSITVQNEVDTTVDGRYASCLWAQEDEILFVGKYLGPLFLKANCRTKIWVLDHNFSLWGRAIAELADRNANEYIDGIAWHGYAGDPSAMSRVHDAFPQKHAYFTEGGPRNPPGMTSDPLTAWSQWSEWATDVLRNWCRSITMWNMVLDEYGFPYIGVREPPETNDKIIRMGRGVVTVENASHKVTRSARFWACAHYSKHVKRGARVFQTDGVGAGNSAQTSPSSISHVGFRNPDGSCVVVLTNRGPEKRVQLLMGTSALDVNLPADSVHTLQWS
jgi:glucosylceramidase